MILWTLLAAAQVAAGEPMPRITLEEALRRAVRVDPGHVAASGRVDEAAWARRAAWSAFVLPSVTATTSATRFSSEFFNIGTGRPAEQIVQAQLEARYDLFRGGAKFYEAGRAAAAMEAARAAELEARFHAELLTESDYYEVLAQRELSRVAAERVRRAEEQFAVARARVLSGAAVRTDSLQLLLELTRARVGLLEQEAALRVARLQLGRRVGVAGPVDAVPLDTVPAPELPITEAEAVAEALASGPRYRAARTEARAADASFKSARGSFLPTVSLFGQWIGFDDSFFPDATTRTAYGMSVSWPLWNRGEREVELTRARASRDAARALRDDAERAAYREAIDAYQAYETARVTAALAAQAVRVAAENLRVQEQRYRAGATTILDLVTAQVDVAEAEAGHVQARYAARLALARLEAVLGRRLFSRIGEFE